MISEGHTIEYIKTREQIIRDFYREWKEKNPSQRKFNTVLLQYQASRMKKASQTEMLNFCPSCVTEVYAHSFTLLCHRSSM